jgi:hypothetical protein
MGSSCFDALLRGSGTCEHHGTRLTIFSNAVLPGPATHTISAFRPETSLSLLDAVLRLHSLQYVGCTSAVSSDTGPSSAGSTWTLELRPLPADVGTTAQRSLRSNLVTPARSQRDFTACGAPFPHLDDMLIVPTFPSDLRWYHNLLSSIDEFVGVGAEVRSAGRMGADDRRSSTQVVAVFSSVEDARTMLNSAPPPPRSRQPGTRWQATTPRVRMCSPLVNLTSGWVCAFERVELRPLIYDLVPPAPSAVRGKYH